MKLHRLALAAVFAGTLVAGPAMVAAATGYESLDPGSGPSSATAPGESVTLVVEGFMPNSMVTIELRIDTTSMQGGSLCPAGTSCGASANSVVLGTFLANGYGVVNATVTIPAGTVSGNHTILATGVNAAGVPAQASIPVTVAPPQVTTTTTTNPNSTTGSFLPRTGADIAATLTVGGALIIVGGASAVAARRRLNNQAG